MATRMEPGSAVPLEEVVPAQAFEFEALLNVLERRGLVMRGEVLGGDRAAPGEGTESAVVRTHVRTI